MSGMAYDSEEAADKAAWDRLHDSSPMKKPGPELMVRFDELLEQYEGALGSLTAALSPILLQGGMDTPGRPEEAPYNTFHEKLLYLERLNWRLREILELIKL